MAKFTVRVELHDADEDDYEKLHEYMEEAGFLRTVASGDGKKYHLPPAEYNLEVNMTRDAVRESGSKAAKRTGKEFAILVTESAGRCWLNLQEAE